MLTGLRSGLFGAGGQAPGQLRAGSDTEFPEDLPQVVFNCAGAGKQLGRDLVVRLSVSSKAGDAGFLWGEIEGRLRPSRSGPLTRGAEFCRREVSECVRAHRVSADREAVRLAGSVASMRQKREAQSATRRVDCVTSVSNQLDVRILPLGRREDTDVCTDVLRAFALDSTIPSSVDAKADDRLVTLAGTVAFHHQRAEAEFVCANVRGVVEIALESSPGSDYIQRPEPVAREVAASPGNRQGKNLRPVSDEERLR